MNKQEYLKVTPNLPIVVCEKHYYPVNEQSTLHRCQLVNDGWECPKCKEIYPYKEL